MVWAAIGASAVGVVGSALLGGGSSGGTGSSSPAAVADPFAAQRQQYQTALQTLMQGGGTSGSSAAQTGMGNIASGAGSASSQSLAQMNAMLTPGNNFTSADPSYQFRLQQGTENVNRGAAKSGLLDSGNRLTALQDYGQGTASTEYASQFARLGAASQTNLQAEQQQFGQLQSIDQNQQNLFQNNYSRLAQLAGANSGQPGQAGQLLASQQAGASAQAQQWGSLAIKGAQSLWSSATSGSGTVDPSAGQYANTQAPVQPADQQTW